MRTTGMGRSFAALLVLAMACGCTVRSADGDGDGKRHLPVRIEVPKRSTPPADDDPKPSATPSAPSVAPAVVLWSRGDSGRNVRELQARLRQVAWLYDGPTGSYDDLTERAVKGFQGKRGLPRTGKTDAVTWKRLKDMTHEPGKWELYLMGGRASRRAGRALSDQAGAVHQQDEPDTALDDRRADGDDRVGALRFGGHAHP